MPQTIALIGAMPPEISLLQESLQNLRSEHLADFDIAANTPAKTLCWP